MKQISRPNFTKICPLRTDIGNNLLTDMDGMTSRCKETKMRYVIGLRMWTLMFSYENNRKTHYVRTWQQNIVCPRSAWHGWNQLGQICWVWWFSYWNMPLRWNTFNSTYAWSYLNILIEREASVSCGSMLTRLIKVENGDKQGDPLTSTQFAIVMLGAFGDSHGGIMIRYSSNSRLFNIRSFAAHTMFIFILVRNILYIVDCDMIAHIIPYAQEFMYRLSGSCNTVGLSINLDKQWWCINLHKAFCI